MKLFRILILGFAALFMMGIAACITLGVALFLYLRLGGEAGELRDIAHSSAGGDWDRKVEVKAPGILFGLGRLVIAPFDANREFKDALSVVRGGQVGIYERRSGSSHSLSGTLIEADESMRDRGWGRIVGVVDRDQLVAVYIPEDLKNVDDVEVAVMVIDHHEMVIVQARGDLESAFELARRHMEIPERLDEMSRPASIAMVR